MDRTTGARAQVLRKQADKKKGGEGSRTQVHKESKVMVLNFFLCL